MRFTALVRPHLEFGNVIWYGITICELKTVKQTYKYILRGYDHIYFFFKVIFLQALGFEKEIEEKLSTQ